MGVVNRLLGAISTKLGRRRELTRRRTHSREREWSRDDEGAHEGKYVNCSKCEDSLGAALHQRAGLELVAQIRSVFRKGQGVLSSTARLCWPSSSRSGLECALNINLLG